MEKLLDIPPHIDPESQIKSSQDWKDNGQEDVDEKGKECEEDQDQSDDSHVDQIMDQPGKEQESLLQKGSQDQEQWCEEVQGVVGDDDNEDEGVVAVEGGEQVVGVCAHVFVPVVARDPVFQPNVDWKGNKDILSQYFLWIFKTKLSFIKYFYKLNNLSIWDWNGINNI